MKKQFINLIVVIITAVLLSPSLSFGQNIGKTKVYSGKAKFLMTEINFDNFKAHENCAGLIMFENVSKKTLRVAAVTKDLGNVAVSLKSQNIKPHQKGILTYTLINPSPGELQSTSLIFFKEFNDPVKITISGNFL